MADLAMRTPSPLKQRVGDDDLFSPTIYSPLPWEDSSTLMGEEEDKDEDGGEDAGVNGGSRREAGGDHRKTLSRDDLANQLRQCAELHDLLGNDSLGSASYEEKTSDALPVSNLSARCEQLRAQLQLEIGSAGVFTSAYNYVVAVIDGEEMEDPSVSDFHDVLISTNESEGMSKGMSRDETEDLLSEMILLLHLESALVKARRPRE